MRFFKLIGRILKILVLSLVALLLVVFIFITAPSWWRRWVTYPRLEKERVALNQLRKEPEKVIPQKDFKGVLHAHTYRSHDSRGVLSEILPAAKKAKLNFIFFSDHPHGQYDTFPHSYNGVYDGIIFQCGTETSNGLMVNPMDSVILDWKKDQNEVIGDIVKNSGLVVYVHSENPHNWSNPDYQAMEIYNIHTDIKDESSLLPFVINSAINGNKYRRWAYREIYDDQTAILANWDSLNQHRRITGVAAVDAHNNQSFRARYTSDRKVEWVGRCQNHRHRKTRLEGKAFIGETGRCRLGVQMGNGSLLLFLQLCKRSRFLRYPFGKVY